jgi:hypothetical protein
MIDTASMLVLPEPWTQDHLNATVVEVIGLNVTGCVRVPGQWDAIGTLRYVESKTKALIVPFHTEYGIGFFAGDKRIQFTSSSVTIQSTADCESLAPETSRRRPWPRT